MAMLMNSVARSVKTQAVANDLKIVRGPKVRFNSTPKLAYPTAQVASPATIPPPIGNPGLGSIRPRGDPYRDLQTVIHPHRLHMTI